MNTRNNFMNAAAEVLMGLAVAAVGIALVWLAAAITEGGAL